MELEWTVGPIPINDDLGAQPSKCDQLHFTTPTDQYVAMIAWISISPAV